MSEQLTTRDEHLQELAALRRRVAELEREHPLASPDDAAGWELELFRVLVESAQELAIFVVDVEGRVITWNAGAERLLGYREEEILGRHFSCFYVEDDLAAGKPARDLELSLREGKQEEETWRVRQNGTRFIANALMVPLHDRTGRLRGFSRVVRDITNRKLAEQALLASEQQFRLFMDNSPTANFIKDASGRLLYVDETWQRTFRSETGDWIGRTDSEVWPADIARRIRDQERTVLDSDQAVESLETLPTHEGSSQWLFYRFRMVEPGGRRLICGTGIDVTERERARREIRDLNADLEQRVQERTAELLTANRELDIFCYSVSHDLRAPLRAIDGFGQALLEDAAERLDNTELDYLHRMRSEAQRLGRLIDDLLELSRVSRLAIRRQPVDLSGLAARIADQLQRQDRERSVEFVIAEGLVCEADEGLLHVVLQNLLENSWKFSSRHPRARIEFGAVTSSAEGVVWFVRDDGVGFNMTYAEHLFDAFQRLHSDNEFPGTGIGLATVERIIHRHGGRIWAEAEVDKGATFYFTLE